MKVGVCGCGSILFRSVVIQRSTLRCVTNALYQQTQNVYDKTHRILSAYGGGFSDKAGPLSDQNYEQFRSVVQTLYFLTQKLEKKHVSIQWLKQMLFGAVTESTRKVMEKILDETEQENTSGEDDKMTGNNSQAMPLSHTLEEYQPDLILFSCVLLHDLKKDFYIIINLLADLIYNNHKGNISPFYLFDIVFNDAFDVIRFFIFKIKLWLMKCYFQKGIR
jgi:hypothetical protein